MIYTSYMSELCSLSIDVGTHSTRVAIVNTQAEILWLKSFSNSLNYKNEAYIEQDALSIVTGLKDLIEQAVNTEFTIVCCGVACQRSTIVAWDGKTGEPLHPAISWLDTRAKYEVIGLSKQLKAIKEKTGLVLSPHYGASKIAWLQRRMKSEGRTGYCIGPLMSFILYHLIDGAPFVVDASNASRTQLFNIYSCSWSKALVNLFDVNPVTLPEVHPCIYNFGRLKGLNGKDIPVLSASGDQNAAYYALSQLMTDKGSQGAVANFGTGAFILTEAQSDNPVPKLLHTLLYNSLNHTQYAIEATVNGAGVAVEWLGEKWLWESNRRISGRRLTRDDFFKAISIWFEEYSPNDPHIPIFINTLGGLASPYWRFDIPHNFITQKEKLTWYERVMAVFESIGFLFRRNLEELEALSPITTVVVSGGLVANKAFRQMLADITGKTVVTNTVLEATLVGAAGLALSTTSTPMQIDASSECLVYTPHSHEKLNERYQTFKHYLDNYSSL